MTTPLNEFTGNIKYPDTMLPYSLLRGRDVTVKRFFTRIENGDFLEVTSVLTFDELTYR